MRRLAPPFEPRNRAFLPPAVALRETHVFPPHSACASLPRMKSLLAKSALLSAAFASATLFVLAAEQDNWKPEPGYTVLYNGRDLTGWGYRDKEFKPSETFDGKTEASDKRYTAKPGILTVNPHVEGMARFRQLYTVKEFPKDFHLKLEFRAAVNADSGIYLRRPQLQCRDYLVAGPYKDLKKYKAQDWNEIEVTVKGDVATCTCNGEALAFTNKLPATGPIGLEADRGTMEYRRIRIKELP